MRRWAIINVLLGLVVALIAVQIAFAWSEALRPITVTPRAPTPAPPAPAPEREKVRRGDKGAARTPQTPEAMIAAVAEKDLFDPSRRQATSEEAGTAAVPRQTEPPPGITVVGVRILGRDREAFVSDASGGNPTQKRLRLGDEIAGYTVKVIEPDALTLSSPSGDLVTMALTVEKGQGAGASPGATRVGAARSAQPAGGSPAAGVQTSSPAAGATGKPQQPGTPARTAAGTAAGTQGRGRAGAATSGTPLAGQNLPSQVRNKMEQLKNRERARSGAKP